MLAVEMLEDEEGLGRLHAEWSALEARAELRHPFLSADWVSAWWEGFGVPGALRVLTARRGGELCAVLPLVAGRGAVSRGLAFVPGRRLALLSNGYADRSGVLAPDGEGEAVSALVARLSSGVDGWDFLDLRYMAGEDLERLRGALEGAGLDCEVFPSDPCYVLRLDGDMESYLASRSGHFRKRLKETKKRLDRAGPWRVARLDELGSPEEALELFLALDRKSWRAETGTAIAEDPAAVGFYRALVRRFAARGGLDLRLLQLGDEPIAGVLAVEYRGRVFGLKTAFDPEHRALSPGTHLLRTLIEDAFERGHLAFDFIRGEDDLRRRWAGEKSSFGRMMVYSRRGKGRLYSFLRRRAVPLARRVLGGAKPLEASG